MRASESHSQPDFFAPAEKREQLFAYTLPDEVLARRRPELENMLQKVQEATVFPWENLTKATCEEMRFNAIARLFPPAEGIILMEAFAAEVSRLYAFIREPWVPLYYAVLKKYYS